MSKLLTNRLHMVLPTLISHLQIVFDQNRDIHDNILIAYEIVTTLQEKKKAYYIGLHDYKIRYEKIL